MEVYILIEQVFSQCEYSYVEVLGVYGNIWHAEEERLKAMQENVKNFNFVRDKENTSDLLSTNRIFQGFQENWNYYIEYTIIQREVI